MAATPTRARAHARTTPRDRVAERRSPQSRMIVFNTLIYLSTVTIFLAAVVHWAAGFPPELTWLAACLALAPHVWWLSLLIRGRR